MTNSKLKTLCFDGNKIEGTGMHEAYLEELFFLLITMNFWPKVKKAVCCCCFILKFGSDLSEVKLTWEILGIFFYVA